MDTSFEYDSLYVGGIEEMRNSSESASSGTSVGMFRAALKKDLSSRFEDEVTATTTTTSVSSTTATGSSGTLLSSKSIPLKAAPASAVVPTVVHNTDHHHHHPASSASNRTNPFKVATAISIVKRPPLHTQKSGVGPGLGTVIVPPIPNHGSIMTTAALKNRFSVFLRIRPASSSSSSSSATTLVGPEVDTIEILNTENVIQNQNHQINTLATLPTKIRTYPPTLSNAMRINVNRQNLQDSKSVPTSSSYAKEFQFDGVLGPQSTQQAVYSCVAAPLIEQVLQSAHPTSSKTQYHSNNNNGRSTQSSASSPSEESALIFSYGITNAGKTHTILGDIESKTSSSWGIIPRALSHILGRINATSNANLQQQHGSMTDLPSSSSSNDEMYLSFYEIYNEQVYDLLPSTGKGSSSTTNNGPSNFPQPLKLRECRGKVLVRGLKRHKVSSIDQGILLSKLAHKKRHTSSNNLNRDSSRSHFVCQMQIVQRGTEACGAPARSHVTSKHSSTTSGYTTDEELSMTTRGRTSTIWIVDLAGSERSKRTNVISNARQKESIQINQSLMTLMRCLNGINESGKNGSNGIIPYRNSKLTHIFQNHLTSVSAWRTAMIVNVNPAVSDFDETQHVLAYARNAKLIKLNPDEFGKKRKQYFGDLYDLDGRKKVRSDTQAKSKPGSHTSKSHNNLRHDNNQKKKTKGFVSRMVEKLSPKRALNKKAPSDHRIKSSLHGVETNGTRDEVPSVLHSSSENSGGDSVTQVQDSEAYLALQKSLESAQEEIFRLEDENSKLLIAMEEKEDEVRTEVVEEMQGLLHETRSKYQEKYDQLRSQFLTLQHKSNMSLTNLKAEHELEELMDKVDEAEGEMVRMNRSHAKEMASKDQKIEELELLLKKTMQEKEELSTRLDSIEQDRKDHSTSDSMEVSNGSHEEIDGKENEDDEPLHFNKFTTKKTGSTMKDRLRKRRKPLTTATNVR